MRPVIHQFSVTTTYGDGITNGMLFIDRLLRVSGQPSKILSFAIDPKLKERVAAAATTPIGGDDVVLVHYGLGSPYDDWIEAMPGRKILVYHNITPSHFFPPGSELRRLAEQGRHRLADWARRPVFEGAIGDSEYNADELRQWGFVNVAAIGLLVDLEHLRQAPWSPAVDGLPPRSTTRRLLFVGRISENKGQLDLVRALAVLRHTTPYPVELVLAGGTSSAIYEARVRAEIARLGLEAAVHLVGKRSDEEILGLYRNADLYVSLSEHEGFGMPLVEAMVFDLPVLAAAAGSIAATLGSGGLLLDARAPRVVAAAIRLLLDEPQLRSAVLAGQRRALARFEPCTLARTFENYLAGLGLGLQIATPATSPSPGRGLWTVEGPFDSSYSLAVVNRAFARALERAGEHVALLARDGPGPLTPDPAVLSTNPDLARMVARHRPGFAPDVALRFQYPPHVAGMRAGRRVLANYAWEESGFPAAWVDEINAEVDLITVASRYVAKVLRDNGIAAPIAVTGYGIDQVLEAPPAAREPGECCFRFLHVSSGFPRKGVDVLLAAWQQAFGAQDPVELVIKCFPNPHNTVAAQIAALSQQTPGHAPVRLIDQDLSEAALVRLMAGADAVVCPSRGEGFCLPLAEAMALGKPVITTSYGGQTDFCLPNHAWLADWRFAYAETHLEVPNSVWVEPDAGSLAAALRACFSASPAERQARAAAGRALVLRDYTWDQVAARTRQAVAALERLPASSVIRLPRIAWVSSWNSSCGIAAYSAALAAAIEPARLIVYADQTSTPHEPDAENVRRLWSQRQDEPLDRLITAITAAPPDALVIQYNFGFFSLAALARLLEAAHQLGVSCFLTLHSTKDVEIEGKVASLGAIRRVLPLASRILVHAVDDLNRLKDIGLVDNVTLFPMGLPAPPSEPGRLLRDRHGFSPGPVLASFGYLLPHKGLRELLRAVAALRGAHPTLRLEMLNARYPIAASADEAAALEALIDKLGLKEVVRLTTDHLPEAEVLSRLGGADLVVFPYQRTQESSSAAVKLGLASGAPVAVTPLPIFADVTGVTHRLPGITPDDLAAGLHQLLADPVERQRLAERQRRWVTAHAWPLLRRRLAGLIRGEAILPRIAGILAPPITSREIKVDAAPAPSV